MVCIRQKSYSMKSTIMVSFFKKLNHIRAGLVAPDLALALEYSNARDGKTGHCFQLIGFKGPSQNSIKLFPHVCPLFTV
jgi:hypothetical protein